MQESIQIFGATHHNLKNIDLEIPRNKLVVICGPSGSGKSTLAFDIIYAEGQRRYVESLSAYARQFLPQMDKPKVEKILGLSPAISLEQHTSSRNPRSTVGTVTEIHDFLRVFFARLGTAYCPQCLEPIQAQTSDEILDSILELEQGTRFMLLAPLAEYKKGTHQDLLKRLKAQGFMRVRVDGQVYNLDNPPELEKNKRHNIQVVVDRLQIKPGVRKRLADSLELALSLGSGRVLLDLVDQGQEIFFSTKTVCARCNLSLPEPSPQLFSFNSPQGACPACAGLGSMDYFQPLLLAPNRNLSLRRGGILPWRNTGFLERNQESLHKLGAKYGFDLDTPLHDLSPQAWEALFYGDKSLGWQGVIPILEQGDQLGKYWQEEMSRFKQNSPCPECAGARLRPEALAVKVQGTSINEVCAWSIYKALQWLRGLEFEGFQAKIAGDLLKELEHRLAFLVEVGLDYLSLDRNMSTLSGGEAQRIRLAGQLGSALVGVTYVLDEPSIGLHPRDNKRLIDSLHSLQSRGNTVLVVEHDEPTIRSAHYVLELGPGSGNLG
ncbi:MAG: ATP-binding cassette domain-containing protein, partial [Desulfohalobiaceae bacterium]